MQEAQGFVTDDGTFFVRREEAQLHEAESKLRAKLAEINGDPDRFLEVVFVIMPELREYINAFITNQRNQTEVEDRAEVDESRAPESPTNLGHVSSTEEDLAALLKLPTRGPSHVPNMGRSPRTEKVQERREEHGSGMRGTNASGVRRRKDMAVKQDTKA